MGIRFNIPQPLPLLRVTPTPPTVIVPPAPVTAGRWENVPNTSVSADGYTFDQGTALYGRWSQPALSGKIYIEVTITQTRANGSPQVGWVDSGSKDFFDNARHDQVFFYGADRLYYSYGVTTPVQIKTTGLPSWVDKQTIMLARDVEAGSYWFGVNGTWAYGTGTTTHASNSQIAAGNAFAMQSPRNMPYLLVGNGSNTSAACKFEINQGQKPYLFPKPAGFGPITDKTA